MGLLGSILGLFNPAGKAADAVDKVLDGAARAADALHYSEEEKDEFKKEMSGSFLRLQEILASESSASAISRRVLAFATMGAFFAVLFLCVAFFPVELYLIHGYKPALLAAETLGRLLADFDAFMLRYAPVTFFYLTLIKLFYSLVLMVMGTYFFYHGLVRVRKGK